MYRYKGNTALVTGASSGIGETFARELAARGMNLIVTARSEEKLRVLAAELSGRYGVRVEVVPADLAAPGAAARIRDEAFEFGMHVDLLINNAGFTTFGPFDRIPAEQDRAQIEVNVAALVDLTHAFLPLMLGRRDGAIINVASVAAFMPSPYQAVYHATKAFVLNFSQALAAAYRGEGVRILALCPGVTATNFFAPAPESFGAAAESGTVRTPEQVVATALRALERGRSVTVDGWTNRALALATRLLPADVFARVLERVIRPAPPSV